MKNEEKKIETMKVTDKSVRALTTSEIFAQIKEAVEKSKYFEFDTTTRDSEKMYFYIAIRYKAKKNYIAKIYCHASFVDICNAESVAKEMLTLKSDIFDRAKFTIDYRHVASIYISDDNRNEIVKKSVATILDMIDVMSAKASADEASKKETKAKETKKETKKTTSKKTTTKKESESK